MSRFHAPNKNAQATPTTASRGPPVATLVLRVAALLVILANIAFNAFYQSWLPGAATIEAVSKRYPALFTPAPYAFAIWALIYAGFVAFAIFQLLPRTFNSERISRLSLILLLANLLASLWIALYTGGQLGASVVVMVASVACGYLLFRTAMGQRRYRLVAPFALYFGWVSVALLAALASWISALGYASNELGDEAFTALLLVLAGAAAAWIALRYDETLFPLVVSWGAFAIYTANRYSDRIVASVALVTAIVAALFAARAVVRVVGAWHMRHLLKRRSQRPGTLQRSLWKPLND